MGCTRDDVRRLAFHLAVQNKIPRPFSIAKEAAGKDWFKHFMKQHSDKLSVVNLQEWSLPGHELGDSAGRNVQGQSFVWA